MEHNQSLKELQEKVAQLEDELAVKNKALSALKETDENFRLLADHTNDAIFIIDKHQKLTFINPAATHLYGFTREELKQIPFDQRYTPDSVQRIWEAVKQHRKHLERGQADRAPFRLELQHYHKNGGLVDLETVISPVYDEDGTYRCAVGIARDITKRKKMEQSLHLHSAAINQIQDLITVTDLDGFITYVNDAECLARGKAREELIGQHVSIYGKGSAAEEKSEDIISKSVQNGFWRGEIENIGRDGNILTLDYRIQMIRDEAGTPVGLCGIGTDITERKKAENRLRDAELERRTLLDNQPNHVILQDLDNRIIWANREACASAQMTREELIGRFCHEIWAQRSAVCPDCPVKKAKETGAREKAEKTTPDGRCWRIYGCPIRNERGEITHMLEVSEDISDRKELERRHVLLADVVERSRDFIGIADLERNALYVNPAGKKMVGLEGDEAVKQSKIEDYFLPEDLPFVKEKILPAIMHEGRWVGEFRFRHFKTGKPVHVLYDLFRSSDPDTGNTTNYSTVTRDITEYKQAEKALRDRQEQLSLALMGADLGTWDWNIQTDSVEFSERWATMKGYSLDEVKPNISTWKSLVHPDDLPKALEKLDAHLAGKTPFYEAEFRMRHRSGQWICILDRGKVIERDAEAKPVRACGTHLDITERKQLEENLRRAQKIETVGTLAGGVAHEFNNIIGGMMGYAEVAKDIVLGANPAHEMLDRILELGSRASDIVRQMLAFSREHETSKSLIRPHVAIKEQIKMLSNIIPASIEIKTGIDESAGSIMANATQLQQVGMNLCTNAVHAMEEKGGVLTITLSQVYLDEEAAQPFHNIRPGNYIKITVGDTGPGIDPAVADRIFDPFFTTKEVNKGTGLGLSVVDGIVRDHGGAITVESTPGTGTVFTVVLPAAEGKKAEDQEEKTADIRGGTERILLVDDEESIIFTMKVILERFGYRVTALTGSIKALQMFRAAPHDFDLIITDLTMPGLTGDNLSAEILSIRPDIPVILMTGYEDMVESDRINMSCIKAFMPKPCKKPELAGTIRRVLDGQ